MLVNLVFDYVILTLRQKFTQAIKSTVLFFGHTRRGRQLELSEHFDFLNIWTSNQGSREHQRSNRSHCMKRFFGDIFRWILLFPVYRANFQFGASRDEKGFFFNRPVLKVLEIPVPEKTETPESSPEKKPKLDNGFRFGTGLNGTGSEPVQNRFEY